MFDTYNPVEIHDSNRMTVLKERLKFHVRNIALLKPIEMIHYLREKTRIAKDGEYKNLMGLKPKNGENASGISPTVSIQSINDLAGTEYKPRPYPGTITVFKPKNNYSIYSDPSLGWNDIAMESVDLVELPVNPHAMLLHPFVNDLARELRTRLTGTPVPEGASSKRDTV